MKTKILLLFVVCLFFASNSVAQKYGTAHRNIKLYPQPKIKNAIAKLPKGSRLEIIGHEKSYYHVVYAGEKGFVYDYYFYPDDDTAPDSLANETLSLTDIDKYKYEIDHLRYCVGRYGRQKSLAYSLQLIGAGVIAIGVSDEEKLPLAYIGGGLSLIGLVIQIDAEKWMKKAYVGSTANGFGVKYRF